MIITEGGASGVSLPVMGTSGFLKGPMGSRDVLRVPRWSRWAFRGIEGVNRYVKGIPWGHWVGLAFFLS